MALEDKYTIKDLRSDFPTEDVCLDLIFHTLHSEQCSCGGIYTRIKGRKQYQCSKCRFQIAPTAGTIFHKSSTPLTDWFYALFVFSNAKSGISAKELERQLGMTYKCAWRVLSQIRKALQQDTDKLSGDVELDLALFGGRMKSGRDNKYQKKALEAKTRVIGAIKRGGDARVKIVPNATAGTHFEFLDKNVEVRGTRLMTDKTRVLNIVGNSYDRHSVNHNRQEYARKDVHINSMENFWGHVKRSIKGTYKVVSTKHLQSYLDSFVWHYNNRGSDTQRFAVLLGTVLRA